MATNINNRLVCNEPHASLDSYYGPYNSVHEAFTALADTIVNGINYTKKYIGLTVGIWNSAHNEITEYWFKGGLNESNLVIKTSDSGGLPSGVKIVTFDKNGGSGAQNSIITDTDSQVVLPECTFTNASADFTAWSYNGTQEKPGRPITIGSTTVVKAIWGYKITWTVGTGINKITGTANGVPISSGDLVQEGSTIELTAIMNSGYNFSQWSGLPSGTSSNNPVTFTLGTSDLNITATGSAATQYYTVSWTTGTHIASITGKYNGTTNIQPGTTPIPAGSTVVLTAEADIGYQFKDWTGTPSGATTSGATMTIQSLSGNVSGVSAVAEAVATETEFCYYGCTPISGNPESKWFTEVGELQSSDKETSVTIDNTKTNYTILYVVRDTNVPPTCTYDNGDTVTFVPINKCSDDEIYNHFIGVNWVVPDSNQTNGELKTKGKYVFILIDNEKVLADKTFTISIEKE